MSRKKDAAKTIQPATSETPWRGFVSLLLVIHLALVFLSLSGNFLPSVLQGRLLGMFSPYYLQTLNFDLDFTRYYLTQGEPLDDDHFIEIEIELPDQSTRTVTTAELGSGVSESWRRHRDLAHVMAFNLQNDAFTARFAKTIGGVALRRFGAERAVVRCRRHETQPRLLDDLNAGFPHDPTAEEYFITLYEADVRLADGEVLVQKRAGRGEVAPAKKPDSDR